jgi:hypothetical protein
MRIGGSPEAQDVLEHRNLLTREPPVNDNEVLATGVLYVNPQHE